MKEQIPKTMKLRLGASIDGIGLKAQAATVIPLWVATVAAPTVNPHMRRQQTSTRATMVVPLGVMTAVAVPQRVKARNKLLLSTSVTRLAVKTATAPRQAQ